MTTEKGSPFQCIINVVIEKVNDYNIYMYVYIYILGGEGKGKLVHFLLIKTY